MATVRATMVPANVRPRTVFGAQSHNVSSAPAPTEAEPELPIAPLKVVEEQTTTADSQNNLTTSQYPKLTFRPPKTLPHTIPSLYHSFIDVGNNESPKKHDQQKENTKPTSSAKIPFTNTMSLPPTEYAVPFTGPASPLKMAPPPPRLPPKSTFDTTSYLNMPKNNSKDQMSAKFPSTTEFIASINTTLPEEEWTPQNFPGKFPPWGDPLNLKWCEPATKENDNPFSSGFSEGFGQENQPSDIHSDAVLPAKEKVRPIKVAKSKKKKVPLQDAVSFKPTTKKSRNSNDAYAQQISDDTEIFIPPDNDGEKPGLSYATLIGLALLDTPEKRLTLSQIYKWISNHYSFYAPDDGGWQNSIRHNLSLNKAFVKAERKGSAQGKGNDWFIKPGQEHQFMKKTVRHCQDVMSKKNGLPILPKRSKQRALQPAPAIVQEEENVTPVTPAPRKSVIETDDFPNISSDATVDQSEYERDPQNFPTDDTQPELAEIFDSITEDDDLLPSPNFTANAAPVESSPQFLHSSPPITRRMNAPVLAPPVVSSLLKRKANDDVDDSGYFSNFDSSVQRPNASMEPPSRRIKRGRAEAEIAKIRNQSSSPIRNPKDQVMLPPLTPMTTLRQPEKAPPSVSPNTNLRRHRESIRNMIGSPSREVEVLETSVLDTLEFTADIYDFGDDPFASGSAFDDNFFEFSPIKRTPGSGRPEFGYRRAQSFLGVQPELSAPDYDDYEFIFGKEITKSASKGRSMSVGTGLERPGVGRSTTSFF